MTKLQFKKATQADALLRCALYGPAGSGKSYTSLAIAQGLRGPEDAVAVIDSERGASAKLAGRFDFDVLELEAITPSAYVDAINAAAEAGYPVLIIDSLSHAWGYCRENVDRLAEARFKGNTWAAWSAITPKWEALLQAILTYRGHVLVTCRAKSEWVQKDGRPQKVGLGPTTRDGSEFEFDLLCALSPDHYLVVEKDRFGVFQDEVFHKPDRAFGERIAGALRGTPPAAPQNER